MLPVWLPRMARAWQADNEWLAGWRDVVETADGLVDFTLLKPTILNERSLRAEDIVAADPATLRRAATVAGAEQIMLVTARLDYDGSQPMLAVDGELFTAGAEALTVLARMVDRPVFNNLSAQLDFARKQILSELETGWHRANIIEGGETREITVSVPVTGSNVIHHKMLSINSVGTAGQTCQPGSAGAGAPDGGKMAFAAGCRPHQIENAILSRPVRPTVDPGRCQPVTVANDEIIAIGGR